MGKIFVHKPRKLRPVQLRPIAAEDPERRRARAAAEGHERRRIEADRRRRMLERSAARVVHSTPQTVLKDQSDCDAEWFRSHPDRNHYVRRRTEGEIPPHLDWGWSWVVVRQIEPGMRIRLPFGVLHGRRKFLDLVSTEEGAAWAFELVASDPNAEAIDSEPLFSGSEGR